MPLPSEHLVYGHRGYGMDHDWYEWSILPQRKPVLWPAGARIALWVSTALEFFPLNPPAEPFKAPGSMLTPYPDLRHYTLRDYGNRVGIFRIIKTLENFGITPTAAVNLAVAERYPSLIEEVVKRDWEIIAGGIDMGHIHHGALDEKTETRWVVHCVETLRNVTGQPIKGWLSPARSQSMRTMDLVAGAGIDYICDWVNDEMPYPVKTEKGPLVAMPHSHEMSDLTIIFQYKRSEEEYTQHLIDQFEVLYREASPEDGRIMGLTVHPWIIGQPHRIKALEKALAHIMGKDSVWAATGAEILAAWQGQQD